MKIQIRNILIVWALTGLWHGASWNFVLWGVYYGILLMIEKLFLLKELEKSPAWFRHVYTLILVVIGWTIFAETDFAALAQYFKNMFGIGNAFVDSYFFYYLSCNAALLILLVLCSIDHRVWLDKFDSTRKIIGWCGSAYGSDKDSSTACICRIFVMVVLMIIAFAFLVGGSYNPFLYFRF